MIAAWIGPAIVAAVISALVTGMGWFVSERQAVKREAGRRRERVIDMQTALLAEIRASRYRLENLSDHGAMIDQVMADQEGYSPFVPKQVSPALFTAIVAEIHILPTNVIDPIVVYYRQKAVIANLVDDIRSERYDRLDQQRKRLLYGDFVRLMQEADLLAVEAEDALHLSLNMTDAGSSGRKSDAARDGAVVQDEVSRSDP